MLSHKKNQRQATYTKLKQPKLGIYICPFMYIIQKTKYINVHTKCEYLFN